MVSGGQFAVVCTRAADVTLLELPQLQEDTTGERTEPEDGTGERTGTEDGEDTAGPEDGRRRRLRTEGMGQDRE